LATRGKKEKEYPPMPANWMYKRGDVYMMDLNPYSGSSDLPLLSRTMTVIFIPMFFWSFR
jgi:hypothetical protein